VALSHASKAESRRGGGEVEGEIDVFDVSGRLVKRLFRGRLTGNGGLFYWDGTNESGSTLASGVYFAAFKYKGGVTTAKMLFLR